ncbi:hypothetical protein [Rhodopirellula sp. SWK7]|uniref:hypothetical protein n=1 Tax=Rhodopirellula sp. SWK7 TaxID=595460 RepID=UPI0002BF2A46|nr:hypothetical protein [Rhodopirellula sp. SWK7]EMI46521.1 secreted protein [Rhodopirellula sp. SWK7]
MLLSRILTAICFATLLVVTVGCSGRTTESVYDADEMAKYRSSPEQIAAAMKASQKAAIPDPKQIKEIAKKSARLAADSR